MIDALDDNPTISFWVISGMALLWNLVGLMFYYMQVTMTPEALAVFTDGQQTFFTGMPTWATSAHAIAVNAGILGSLFLLLRKSWAIPMFAVSLLCIVASDVYAFVISNVLDLFGSQAIIMPSIVAAIAVALLLYARVAKVRRWIS